MPNSKKTKKQKKANGKKPIPCQQKSTIKCEPPVVGPVASGDCHAPSKIPTISVDTLIPTDSNGRSENPQDSVDLMTSRDFQTDINAHISVAGQLLKDHIYIRQYQAAIIENRHLFRGKTVLNIGCGFGILSLFAAKAGAARVYAVDRSNVCDYTRRIVQANGYADIIHVIQGRIEEVQLPVKKVDIIVSDWMGYSLLFEATCDAVIYARDKWLIKGTGIIYPDIAKLYVSFLEDGKRKNERVNWWTDVYGFNMRAIREFALSEPTFQSVQPHQILSHPCIIKDLNLNTAKIEDLKFRSKYMLKILRSGSVDGIFTYFNVQFSKSHTPLYITTDPWSARTHWMQSVFFFDKPITAQAEDVLYGGIEIYSSGGKCDLNNMEMSLEMYSGDPNEYHLETEMHWKTKPTTVMSQIEETAAGNDVDGAIKDVSTPTTAAPGNNTCTVSKTKANGQQLPLPVIEKENAPRPTNKIRKKCKYVKKDFQQIQLPYYL